MPAKSRSQRKFFGIALAVKKGKTPKSYSPEATKAAKSMSKKALKHFAKTKEVGLPKRKNPSNKKKEKRLILELPGEKGTRYPMLTKEPSSSIKHHIRKIDPGEQLDRTLWPKAKKFNRLKRI